MKRNANYGIDEDIKVAFDKYADMMGMSNAELIEQLILEAIFKASVECTTPRAPAANVYERQVRRNPYVKSR